MKSMNRADKSSSIMAQRVFWPWAMLVAVITFATAATSSADDSISSVIQVIGESTKEFKDTMDQKLGANLAVHRRELQGYIQQAEQDLIKIASSPGNDEYRIDYEDHLSLGLQASNKMLNAMLAARDDILPEVQRVSESIETAISTFERAAKADADERAASAIRVEEIEATLREFALSHREIIESGGELPSEVREPIRILESELRVEKAVAGFQDRVGTTDILENLRAHQEDLAGMEEDLRVAFDRAAKQKRLIAKIADFRRRGMYVGMLARETESLRSLVFNYKSQIDDLEGWTDQMVQTSAGALPEISKANRLARSQAIVETLKKYIPADKLTRSSEAKGQTNVSTH